MCTCLSSAQCESFYYVLLLFTVALSPLSALGAYTSTLSDAEEREVTGCTEPSVWVKWCCVLPPSDTLNQGYSTCFATFGK